MATIPFTRHQLKNGLTLIIHPDKETPMAAGNMVYRVGSRDEDPEQTGMAHLFEHFMFSGSAHVAHFDQELQKAGGVNNAYTSQDITHYYAVLPAHNLETLFWLESDRMLSPAFNPEQLEIQKQVVMEEFKENYLNRPFGNLWRLFHHQIYLRSPYRWLPIGEDLSHIASVDMEAVKGFFHRFYRPGNAVFVVSGPVVEEEVVALAEKWFGDIPDRIAPPREYPEEEEQRAARFQVVEEEVPYELLVKGWLMGDRLHPEFHAHDLLADLLGGGQSSYLYRKFVTEEPLFTSLSAHVSAVAGPGTFVIMGTPAEGVSLEDADRRLGDFLYRWNPDASLSHNLQKVKNRVETILLHNEIKLEERSSHLAVSEALGGIERYDREKERYFAVSEEEVRRIAGKLLREERSNTLFFRKPQGRAE